MSNPSSGEQLGNNLTWSGFAGRGVQRRLCFPLLPVRKYAAESFALQHRSLPAQVSRSGSEAGGPGVLGKGD